MPLLDYLPLLPNKSWTEQELMSSLSCWYYEGVPEAALGCAIENGLLEVAQLLHAHAVEACDETAGEGSGETEGEALLAACFIGSGEEAPHRLLRLWHRSLPTREDRRLGAMRDSALRSAQGSMLYSALFPVVDNNSNRASRGNNYYENCVRVRIRQPRARPARPGAVIESLNCSLMPIYLSRSSA
jgi:hypothetical protein